MSQRQHSTSSDGYHVVDLGLADLVRALEPSVNQSKPKVSANRFDHYMSMVNSGNWQELLELAEQDFKQIGESDILARLFWIRANLDFGEFPRGMLGVSLQRLLADLGKDSSASLQEFEGALQMVEAVTLALRQQLSEAPHLCAELEISLRSVRPAGEAVSVGQIAEESTKMVDFDVGLETEAVALESTNVAALRSWLSISLARGISILLAPCLIYCLWLEYQQGFLSSAVLGSWINGLDGQESLKVWHRVEYKRVWDDLERSSPELIFPAVLRIQDVGELSGLSYSLEELSDVNSSLALQKSASKEISKPAQKRVPVTPLPVVNTTQPVEPYMIEPEVDRSGEQQVYSPSFPRRKNYVMEHFATRDEFRANRVDYYEIVVDTSVFSRPALSATRLTDLRRGDRVFVEDDSGRWLTVRSNSGKIGFVLKRDTNPAP